GRRRGAEFDRRPARQERRAATLGRVRSAPRPGGGGVVRLLHFAGLPFAPRRPRQRARVVGPGGICPPRPPRIAPAGRGGDNVEKLPGGFGRCTSLGPPTPRREARRAPRSCAAPRSSHPDSG